MFQIVKMIILILSTIIIEDFYNCGDLYGVTGDMANGGGNLKGIGITIAFVLVHHRCYKDEGASP